VPIGANDYALEWYRLDETEDDYAMSDFSVARDERILIPYIKAAMAIRPN
jgi:glucosylceramidase